MENQVTTTQTNPQNDQIAQQIIQPAEIGVQLQVPVAPTDVVPLNCQVAFAKFSPEEQQEIRNLADAIDVRQIDKVMSYGSPALKATFDQCGKFLKDERGSDADQKVIEQVIALSKKASESYDDFNLVLQEPGFFQKLFTRMLGAGKNSHAKKIQTSAVTNYKLLVELKDSCDSWLDMLKRAMGEIEYSAISDIEAISLLEKYIIAGKIAEERVVKELEAARTEYQETGLQVVGHQLKELEEGFDLFEITMANLEKSRVMYHLSIGQLGLIKRSNRNVQISIHTQVDNSMALIGQQLRNAVLNAKTREVLEGQKAINRLSDELIKDISRTAGLTAEETERLIYAGFYNVDAAKEAVTTVINSCEAIKKTASEMLPKMKADMTQLDELVKQLEPYVARAAQETLSQNNATTTPTNGGTGKLSF